MAGGKQVSGHRTVEPLAAAATPWFRENPRHENAIATSPILALSILALAAVAGAAAAQQAPTRGIVNVTGQLYRAQNNNHYTVLLVTPEGVIMSDPINRDFGRWLKARDRHAVQGAGPLRALHPPRLGPRVGRRRLRRHRGVRRPPQHARGAGAAGRQSAADRGGDEDGRQPQRAGGARRSGGRHPPTASRCSTTTATTW